MIRDGWKITRNRISYNRLICWVIDLSIIKPRDKALRRQRGWRKLDSIHFQPVLSKRSFDSEWPTEVIACRQPMEPDNLARGSAPTV